MVCILRFALFAFSVLYVAFPVFACCVSAFCVFALCVSSAICIPLCFDSLLRFEFTRFAFCVIPSRVPRFALLCFALFWVRVFALCVFCAFCVFVLVFLRSVFRVCAFSFSTFRVSFVCYVSLRFAFCDFACCVPSVMRFGVLRFPFRDRSDTLA